MIVWDESSEIYTVKLGEQPSDWLWTIPVTGVASSSALGYLLGRK